MFSNLDTGKNGLFRYLVLIVHQLGQPETSKMTKAEDSIILELEKLFSLLLPMMEILKDSHGSMQTSLKMKWGPKLKLIRENSSCVAGLI